MKITLGENIRTLRNRDNITQEQLAEALEVSPQAVSRWENEATFPDISVLPVLANYFGVTTDYLLGVDTAHKQKEIDRAVEWDAKLRSEGKTRKSVEFLREKAKEFPSSHIILHRLACSLFSLYHQSGEVFDEREKNEMARESAELCKRALKYCDKNDQLFIGQCKQTLVLNFVELGERERAENIADTLPSFWCSREMVYPKTLFEKDALREWQEFLLMLIDAVVITMGRIKSCEKYTDEQLLKLSEVRERFILELAGENPCWLNERLFNLALIRAKIYLRNGDKEKLSDIMPRLVGYARSFDERRSEGKYEAFWLSELRDNPGSETRHSSESLCDTLRGFMDKCGINDFDM